MEDQQEIVTEQPARCPDPECDRQLLAYVQCSGVVIPAHNRPGSRDMLWAPSCWTTGIPLAEARELVRMREADGGRLLTRAHP